MAHGDFFGEHAVLHFNGGLFDDDTIIDLDRIGLTILHQVEGYIGFYGFIMLIPVFLTMTDWLGQSMPKLAAFISVIALIGFAGGGVMQMVLRTIIAELVSVGVTAAMFEQLQANFESGQSPLILLILMGPLIPLSSLLLGIGFLLAKQLRWQAWLFVASGVLFLTGQFFVVATEITYTLAMLLWAVIFIPLGLRFLRGDVLPSRAHG